MKIWSPGGTASGAGSQLIAHEFGHASGLGYYEGGASIMNNPPGSWTDPASVGAIIDRCEGKRIDDEEQDQTKEEAERRQR